MSRHLWTWMACLEGEANKFDGKSGSASGPKHQDELDNLD